MSTKVGYLQPMGPALRKPNKFVRTGIGFRGSDFGQLSGRISARENYFLKAPRSGSILQQQVFTAPADLAKFGTAFDEFQTGTLTPVSDRSGILMQNVGKAHARRRSSSTDVRAGTWRYATAPNNADTISGGLATWGARTIGSSEQAIQFCASSFGREVEHKSHAPFSMILGVSVGGTSSRCEFLAIAASSPLLYTEYFV